MKLEPLGDRIVIKIDEPQEKKVGGIIIPETAKERPQVGIMMAVGTDEEVQENLKVKDRVVYAKYGGTEIEVDGEEYIILSYGDVLAKLS